MNVQVTVIGDGVVTGAGTHSMGNEVTLTASTSSFSYFYEAKKSSLQTRTFLKLPTAMS